MANFDTQIDTSETVSSSVDTTKIDHPVTEGKANDAASVEQKPSKDRVENQVNSELSKAIGALAFRQSDVGSLTSEVRSVLRTISAMNQARETDIGIKVDGELYRFEEYELPKFFSELVGPAKVVAVDVVTAKDFLDRSKYADPGHILDPAALALSLKRIFKMLKVNPDVKSVERPNVWLLSEATKYAVTSGKVVDSGQTRFVYLTTKFDDEAMYSIAQWAKKYAASKIE